jgi:hypothetical protein
MTSNTELATLQWKQRAADWLGQDDQASPEEYNYAIMTQSSFWKPLRLKYSASRFPSPIPPTYIGANPASNRVPAYETEETYRLPPRNRLLHTLNTIRNCIDTRTTQNETVYADV